MPISPKRSPTPKISDLNCDCISYFPQFTAHIILLNLIYPAILRVQNWNTIAINIPVVVYDVKL
jgi:hypothetical protein